MADAGRAFFTLMVCLAVAILAVSGITKADLPQSTTAYFPQNNTCFTEANNFQITTYNCKAQDIDGRDITQYVSFEWKGGIPLDTKWVFAYSGNLVSGSLSYWGNISYQGYEPANKTANLTVHDVASYSDAGEPSPETCDVGNQWNTYAYNVTLLNGTSYVYCFSQFGQIDSTTYWLMGTYDGWQQATKYRMGWKDITSEVEYAGYDLLGHGYSFYYVKQATFQPDQRLDTKWVFTPEDVHKNGKWHIFGWKAGQTLQEAIDNNQYIYQDPWWNNNWAIRKPIEINTSQPLVNINVNLNLTIESGALPYGKDFRFTNNCSNDSVELNFYNTSVDDDSFYATIWLGEHGTNRTICLYYGNPSADYAGDGFKTFLYFDDFNNYTDGDLVGQGGWLQQAGTGANYDIFSLAVNFTKYEGLRGIRYLETDDDQVKRVIPSMNSFVTNKTKIVVTWHEMWNNSGSWDFIVNLRDSGGSNMMVAGSDKVTGFYEVAFTNAVMAFAENSWYQINMTYPTDDGSKFDTCISNSTDAACLTYPWAGTLANANYFMFNTDGAGKPQDKGNRYMDLIYVANQSAIPVNVNVLAEEYVPALIINVIQPFNTTYANSSIDFNITSNNPLAWAKVQLLSTNHTMLNQSGQWQYSNHTLAEGAYNAVFWVNSTSDMRGIKNIWFTIDTTPPHITVHQPFNITYPNVSIDFNITVDEPASSCIIQLFGTNHTMVNQSGQWQYSNHSLTDLTYKATFYCNDTAGNTNSTVRYFTIGVPPTMAIISPANITYYQNSTIPLQWVANEPVDWSAYSLNGAPNVTISGNTTFTAQSGSNHLVLWANDTVGNMNSSDVWFTFNTTYPWWNRTWKFRKPITITTTTPKTFVQVRLNISYEINMSPDFSDVRFLSDCSPSPSLLNAWNQTIVDSSSMLVWLNLSVWGTNNTYCMYYGNPDADSYWDGFATFQYFQDYNDLNDGDISGQDGYTYRVKNDPEDFNVGNFGGAYEGAKAVHTIFTQPDDVQLWRNITRNYQDENSQIVFTTHLKVNGSDVSAWTYMRDSQGGATGIISDAKLTSDTYPTYGQVTAGFDTTWVSFTGWANNTWYELNFSMHNNTHYTMCLSNSTMPPICKTGLNFYSIVSRTSHISFVNGGTGGNGTAMWDLTYVANHTDDNLVYSVGSEEEVVVSPISIGSISVLSPTSPLENSTIQVEASVNVTGDGFDAGNCSLYNPNGTIRNWGFAVEAAVNVTFTTLNCTFDMHYYSVNGTYNVSVIANNTIGDAVQTDTTFQYNALSAFALNETSLNFGVMVIGQSSVVAFDAVNTGNQELNLEMNGTDMVGANDTIGVSNLTFDDTQGMPTPTTLSPSFQSFTALSVLETATGYLNLTVPPLSYPELYSSNVTVRDV